MLFEDELNVINEGPEGTSLLYSSSNTDDQYGNHPAIQTVSSDAIRVVYKAEFEHHCLTLLTTGSEKCFSDKRRKYFHIHENGYELSEPLCCTGLSCCSDPLASSRKYFFDQGVFFNDTCLRQIHCVEGRPLVYANNVNFICCGSRCFDGLNDCLNCYGTSLCGERVTVLPYETWCFCLPAQSNEYFNCCGLMGVESGQPLPCCLVNLQNGLRRGTALRLANALSSARDAWKNRTGIV